MTGVPFAVGAVVAGLVAVGLIGAVRSKGRIREDAAIGIVFTVMFALGLVLISVTPSQSDLHSILFGNVLGVAWADVLQLAILGVLVTAALLFKQRDLTLYAFDSGYANAIGLRPRFSAGLLLVCLVLT